MYKSIACHKLDSDYYDWNDKKKLELHLNLGKIWNDINIFFLKVPFTKNLTIPDIIQIGTISNRVRIPGRIITSFNQIVTFIEEPSLDQLSIYILEKNIPKVTAGQPSNKPISLKQQPSIKSMPKVALPKKTVQIKKNIRQPVNSRQINPVTKRPYPQNKQTVNNCEKISPKCAMSDDECRESLNQFIRNNCSPDIADEINELINMDTVQLDKFDSVDILLPDMDKEICELTYMISYLKNNFVNMKNNNSYYLSIINKLIMKYSNIKKENKILKQKLLVAQNKLLEYSTQIESCKDMIKCL